MIILIRVRSSPAIWPYAPPPHIHRSPRGDLLCRLHLSTVLPILAGEDQKLVITHGAGSSTDKIRINYIRRGDQLVRRRPQHLRSVPPPPPRQPRHPTYLAPPLASRRLTCLRWRTQLELQRSSPKAGSFMCLFICGF
ncbi:hypothetical protein PVAP13_5NG505900 [Panicum virgatum]|uniref:Uncharacterized protein n=1 Tax=Panicum virgatum TaxID=38727 RepID=A0A8T0S1M7_PANVG|nr:hypothetical protein PVAP13_5NG505900 [Panicum virgatum]